MTPPISAGDTPIPPCRQALRRDLVVANGVRRARFSPGRRADELPAAVELALVRLDSKDIETAWSRRARHEPG